MPSEGMAHVHGEAHHGSRKTYVIVGVILSIITAVEVAVFYIEALKSVLIPVLLVLSLVKFVTVVEFFMHLKYDNRIFSRVFFGPLMLAVLVVVGMIMLFKVIPKYAW
ncbi:MAG TPA: cytochrome C oxidase subunit IV family protein [Longimicrobiales bacterium]